MESHTENPLLGAALDYARRGWRVVPLHEVLDSRDGPACSCGRAGCSSQGKHPRVRDWPKAASSDPGVVAGWWRAWPGANVGVALGRASGVVAIDVDTEDGERMLRDLAGGDPEPTLTFRTGKGRRLLYAVPELLEDDPHTVARQGPDGNEAVRFQGTGGQCVMPPSRHPSGRTYEWVGDPSAEPAPMPPWLIAEMGREPPKPAYPREPVWADQAAREAFPQGPDFNRDADWCDDVLAPAGFKPAGRDDRGVARYTRPGKAGGISVTVGHWRAADGTPALFVFSGSIPGLEQGRCYDKFGAYARLFHAGDFPRAARELARRGFGTPARAAERGRPADPAAGPPPWEPAVPLPGLPPVPAFPLDAVPPALADYLADVAATTNTPVDYPGSFALAVAAGTAGATYALEIKPGYVQRPSLYLCAVAPKGSGKSPALDAVAEPVYDEQAALRASGEKGKKAFVSDVTAEKLAELLHDNPRGVLMVRDELAGWLLSFNQYKSGGRGNDRQFYLSAWSGSPVSVDRKNKDSEPVYVRYPCLTVVGTIQPSVLDRFKADSDDGFYDRILFCYPDEVPLAGEQWQSVDPARAARWAEALRDLRGLPMREGGSGPRPHFLRLDQDARSQWQAWTDSVAEQVNAADFEEALRGPYVKLSGYAARLALVSHLLRAAYGEGVRGEGVRGPVDGEDMRRGVALACYFLGHAARAWAAVGLDPRFGPVRRLLRWVAGRNGEPFTRRDAHRALQRSFPTAEALTAPLAMLVQHGFVRYAPTPEGGVGEGNARGRPAVVYEIHPELCQQRQQCHHVTTVNVSTPDDAGGGPATALTR